MKVHELIAILSKCNPEAEVYTWARAHGAPLDDPAGIDLVDVEFSGKDQDAFRLKEGLPLAPVFLYLDLSNWGGGFAPSQELNVDELKTAMKFVGIRTIDLTED